MDNKKIYYKFLDVIRIISCIAVCLYHFNILKGGFLAVCCFFVLSGYLAVISIFKKENFSLKDYYLNRLFKIYIPVLVVVFITIFAVSFLDFNYLNLKNETTSILFSYNNFWQLKTNLDYFAHQIASPFMHLWYISILIQFELIFPIVCLGFKKIKDKVNNLIPCIITLLIAIASVIYFYIVSFNGDFMLAYYNTFTRLFSLMFGVLLGFIHCFYGPITLEIKKIKNLNKIIFYIYLIILCTLFVTIDSKSVFFESSMVLSTFITLRLIDYAIKIKDKTFNKITKHISSYTYLIYLWQYPIIFIFQVLDIKGNIIILIMSLIIIVLSILFEFILNKKKHFKILKYILLTITIIISILGLYKYIISKNYEKELNKLKEELSQNEEIIQNKFDDYKEKLKNENEEFENMLKDLDSKENDLEGYVKNLSVVGVGDSVMLGAVQNLYGMFENGYFDAKVSRTAWIVNDILIDLKANNILGNPIVLNLGANGDCSDDCKDKIMTTCGEREVFWINVTNDNEVHINKHLSDYASTYNNLHIIDWETISKDHPEYFYADHIHLTESGREAYTNAIYESIYNVYLKKYQEEKDKLLKEHEEELKNKISFYGDDLLLSIFTNIQNNFKDDKFIINKNYTYKDLLTSINENDLTKKIVLILSNSFELSKTEYEEIFNSLKDSKIYIVSTNKNTNSIIKSINNQNVILIDFYSESLKNKNYFEIDNIHLTNDGKNALIKLLNKSLN